MNFIILGPAGSGKGTQAKKLAQKFDLFHIDMGQTLRQVAKMDTEVGKKVYHIQNVTKALVPSEILRKVLHLKLASIPREQGIIFDGVPRNLDQMEYIDEILLEFGRKLDKVFFVKIDEKEAKERISRRVICEKCKAGFILGRSVKKMSDICPLCEGRIIQRTDDTQEGVAKRFKVFLEETTPILDKYKSRGILVEIDGRGSIEEVFKSIIKEYDS